MDGCGFVIPNQENPIVPPEDVDVSVTLDVKSPDEMVSLRIVFDTCETGLTVTSQ